MRLALSGLTAAKGLALGRARIRQSHVLDIEERTLAPEEAEAEVARLLQAMAATRAELAGLREQLQGALTQEIGEFLDMHVLLLDDPELTSGLTDLIQTGLYSASYALKLQHDRLAAVFEAMDDPYLRSRREDIDQVLGRVQAALQRGLDGSDVIGLAGEVLIADNVAPAELAQLSERGVVAVLVAQGSTLSHSAIMARSLGIPMLVVAADVLGTIQEGNAVMVDGGRGQIIVEPDPDDLLELRTREFAQGRERRALTRLRDQPTTTRDGFTIRLFANAESREDIARAHRLGVTGVGLYRTELLFLQRREPPDEDEQLAAYRDAVLGMNGRPVTLRCFDLGADKADSAGISLPREPNPALGLRGIRLALVRPALFRTQLRAMLRASAYGPVRILIPMVTRREEMVLVRRILRECASELRHEGHHLPDTVELGAMIEVPAAAIALSPMLATVDFVSIGSNDLVQYLLAADRGNDALGEMFSPLYPAVIRVLHEVIRTCRASATPISICGEIAGDTRFTRLLLALGLTDFSMHPSSLLDIRAVIRNSSLRPLRRQAGALLRAGRRATLERIVARL